MKLGIINRAILLKRIFHLEKNNKPTLSLSRFIPSQTNLLFRTNENRRRKILFTVAQYSFEAVHLIFHPSRGNENFSLSLSLNFLPREWHAGKQKDNFKRKERRKERIRKRVLSFPSSAVLWSGVLDLRSSSVPPCLSSPNSFSPFVDPCRKSPELAVL